MRWLFALALAVLIGAFLAGCSQSPSDHAAPTPTKQKGADRLSRGGAGGRDEPKEAAGDGNVTQRWLNESVGLQLTSATALFDIGGLQGNNCLEVGPAPFTIVAGNASATWTPQSMLTQTLDLIAEDPGDDVYRNHPGASPNEEVFQRLPEATEAAYYGYYSFGLRLDGFAGAAYQQDASFTLGLTYLADHDLTATLASC